MTFPYNVNVRADGKDGLYVDVQPEPIASSPEFVTVVALSIVTVLKRHSDKPNTFGRRVALKDDVLAVLEDLHGQGIIVPKPKKEKDEGTPYLDHLGHKKSTSITKKA